jgi:hypothetical protein
VGNGDGEIEQNDQMGKDLFAQARVIASHNLRQHRIIRDRLLEQHVADRSRFKLVKAIPCLCPIERDAATFDHKDHPIEPPIERFASVSMNREDENP